MNIRILAAILGALVVGCGDGGDGDGSGGGQEPESVSEAITAAEGGEVEVAGALLTIEGGALGEDVTIEVEAAEPSADLPDQATLHGLVYDFGPDGTTFDPPATLELPLDGSVPEGKEAVVSWLDGDAWVDLPTEVVGGNVSVEVEHFTMFIVRFRDVAASEISCDFEACGGELVGSWKIIGACANTDEMPSDGENPFESCGGSFEVILDGSGSAEFGDDGNFSAMINLQPSVSYTIPKACIAMFGDVSTCDQVVELFDDSGEATCTGDVDSACVCEAPVSDAPEPVTVMGTYSTDGNNLVTTSDGEAASNPMGYCVDGTKAKVQFSDTLLILEAQ